MKTRKYMSGVNVGRLLTLIWNVIRPASSFETTMLVMSGALASSPIESGNVCELAAVCDDPPSATGTPTTSAVSARRIASLDLIGASLQRLYGSVDVFARVHTLETTPEGHDRGLELLREILPWLRESTGFRGVIRLAAPDRSKSMTITLWADEAAMLESAEAAQGLGTLAAEASGSKRIALDDFEVTFFEAG
jgi:hypothetical protein